MKFSKIGISFLGIYLIFTAGLWIYAMICKGLYCGFMVFISLFPWVFILERYVGDSIFIYLLIVLLNSILLYLLGIGLSKLWSVFQSRNTSK